MGEYQWNWGVLLGKVSGTEEYYYQWLISGLGWTVLTSLSAWVIAMSVGTVIGTLRTVPNRWVSGLARVWVEVFRNVPLLVQLFIWYFVIPDLLPEKWGLWIKQDLRGLVNFTDYLPEFLFAVLGLGLFTSARVAEQVRTGIITLSGGQKNAGLALGLNLKQVYRYVLLPMAFRIILPPLTSEFMNIFKNSSVALAIGLTELSFQMKQITGEYAPANPIEVMTVVGIMYLALAFSINRLMNWLEQRARVPGFVSPEGH